MEKDTKKPKIAANDMWNVVASPPDAEPDIILIFHGLMALWQPNKSKLEFVSHGQVKKHKLKVSVGKCVGGVFQGSPRKTINPPNLSFLTTNNPSEVKVYSDGLKERSFDWIIDLEKEHHQKLDKEHTPHKISILDGGILYTYATTTAKFFLDGAPNWTESRQVAAMLAINIYLDAGKEGILVGYNNSPKTFPKLKKGETHVIIFDNDCQETSGKRCQYYPNRPTPQERNDFYLNYENIIDNSAGRVSEFFLRIDPANPGSGLHFFDNDCNARPFSMSKDKKFILESNNSPCTATGYGRTGESGGGG